MATTVLKWKPRGVVLFGTRDTTVSPNKPKVFGGDNCADQISLALNTTTFDHTSKCGAVDALDYSAIKSLSADLTIDLTDYTPANLLLGLNAGSVVAEVSATAVTGEVLPAALVAGDTVALGGANPHFNLTAVVVHDSAGSPATLALTTDYTVDAPNGMIHIVNVGSYVQPFTVNYSHQDPLILAALAAGQVERWVRFNGFNVANANKLVDVDMFRAQLAPTAAFDLLPDDIGTMSLKAKLLADLSRPVTDPRGQYFSVALAA